MTRKSLIAVVLAALAVMAPVAAAKPADEPRTSSLAGTTSEPRQDLRMPDSVPYPGVKQDLRSPDTQDAANPKPVIVPVEPANEPSLVQAPADDGSPVLLIAVIFGGTVALAAAGAALMTRRRTRVAA
jgi:hypothetical protein